MKKIENIIYPYENAETLISYSLPDKASDVTVVLGHGKFNDMTQPLLEYLAKELVSENINVVRFNYPFVDGGKSKARSKARKVYDKVLEDIQSELPDTMLFIGGKSYSAVIASDIRDRSIKGYVFIGFPLNTGFLKIKLPVKPLFKLEKPMMFIQGANDRFSDRGRMETLMGALNPYARLMLVPDADHSLELEDTEKRSQSDLNKEIKEIICWFCSDVITKELEKN